MKLWVTALLLTLVPALSTKPATELFLRGYSVIPAPREVELRPEDIEFSGAWSYELRGLSENHIAVRSLLQDLKEFHGLSLKQGGTRNILYLGIEAGAVKTDSDPGIDRQGYRLHVAPQSIEIVGNSEVGLFYGVQTLLQLLRPASGGRLLLPACTIKDWPAFEMRFLHWDTKHHQDRIETLKRYLDWSARFKVNRIGFELEDKFEYPSHPVIGAPGAFTTEELQEIVDYGLQRYIQVVPQIQSPAHMAYVLKHPQFADLRADGNNYQICLCDEHAYQLIFSMYEDVIKATRGVDYFFVSTDEVYYAGICAKCDKPYTPENRSLKWVEFVNRAHQFLTSRGRKMLVWAEYPLLPEHVRLLPPDITDGVLGDDEKEIEAENAHGIRQLVYTSTQGAEWLIPDHLPVEVQVEEGDFQGRLYSVYRTLGFDAWKGRPIGVYGAAWDDSGLHNETFWLGWATVAQYGWAPGKISVEQTAAEFMNIYYGPRVTGMVEIYRDLQGQARFFQNSWDRVVSRVRGPGYGNSEGKGIGTTRYDRTLPKPALPSLPGLDFVPVYLGPYSRLAAKAQEMLVRNDRLIHRIQEQILKADRNRYNLEVLLWLAEFTAHHSRMLWSIQQIENRLQAAREAAEKGNPEEAMERLTAAYEKARRTVEDRHEVFQFLESVWEKSRFPKGREVNGRKFYHVLDDTKDHWADRRPDLSYLTAPEESMDLENWMKSLSSVIRDYANSYDLAVSELPKTGLRD